MNIWAIANQKGGVGKTTTAVTLAGLLAQRGHETLLVDLDPQGSLTAYFGHDPESVASSVYDIFANAAAGIEACFDGIRATSCDRLSLVPASTALSTLDRRLGARDGMGLVVERYLARLADRYEYVLVDCPPALGLLMVNALAACKHLIVPVQTEFLAFKGLERMLHTLGMVKRSRRQELPYVIVPTLFDRRTRASLDTLKLLHERYPDHLWTGTVPVDTQLREASRIGKPASCLFPQARAVIAYSALLDSLTAAAGQPVLAVASV